jgi:hypothetical protein
MTDFPIETLYACTFTGVRVHQFRKQNGNIFVEFHLEYIHRKTFVSDIMRGKLPDEFIRKIIV